MIAKPGFANAHILRLTEAPLRSNSSPFKVDAYHDKKKSLHHKSSESSLIFVYSSNKKSFRGSCVSWFSDVSAHKLIIDESVCLYISARISTFFS
jgi:hypothetical protein